jgi:hypothetical protein
MDQFDLMGRPSPVNGPDFISPVFPQNENQMPDFFRRKRHLVSVNPFGRNVMPFPM